MIVKKKEDKWAPIEITLENEEEFGALLCILGFPTDTKLMQFAQATAMTKANFVTGFRDQLYRQLAEQKNNGG